MSFYWVNIGISKDFVRRNDYLWAPQYGINKSNNRFVDEGWKQVPFVKKGDVIFCCHNQYIVFVAVASSDAFECGRPEDPVFEAWELEGYRIDVDLVELSTALSIKGLKPTLYQYYNDHCYPKLLTTSGLRQNYLTLLGDSAAAYILNELGEDSFLIQDGIIKNSSKSDVTSRKRKGSSREVIAKARNGQQQFRKDVLELWNNTCPITKVQVSELLIASHIVSWQLSDEVEKVDKYNGFPFSPDVDKLFDKGLISFTEHGELLLHPNLDSSILSQLGISLTAKIELKEKNIGYLQRHRKIFGF